MSGRAHIGCGYQLSQEVRLTILDEPEWSNYTNPAEASITPFLNP